MYITYTELTHHYSWTPFGSTDSSETQDRESWWGPLNKKDNLITGDDESGWSRFNRDSNRKVLHILGHGSANDPHLYGMGGGKLHGSEVAQALLRHSSKSAVESLQLVSVYACYASTSGGVGHAFAKSLSANVKVIGSNVPTWKVLDNPKDKRVELWVVGTWPKKYWFYENWHDTIKDKSSSTRSVAKKIKVKPD